MKEEFESKTRPNETIESVADWGRGTLGPCELLPGLSKVAEEIGEAAKAGGLGRQDIILLAIRMFDGYLEGESGDVFKELDDICISALTLPERMGGSTLSGINRGMRKNRAREWNISPNGFAKHKKGDE